MRHEMRLFHAGRVVADAEPTDPRGRIRRSWAQRIADGRVPSLAPRHEIRAAVDAPDEASSVGVLYLYDPIDAWFGVTATDLVAAVAQLGDVDRIELHINCPGGDVFDAIAFLNTLRQHPAPVDAIVDGLAASAASFIAAGCDTCAMAPNSQMMVHDAWGICIGAADDMRQMGDMLDKVSDNIADIYATKSGGTAADWRAVMVAEAWYSDAEAVEAGLADRVLGADEDAGVAEPADPEPEPEPATADNLYDLSAFTYSGRGLAPAPAMPGSIAAAVAAQPQEEAMPPTQPDPTAAAPPAAPPTTSTGMPPSLRGNARPARPSDAIQTPEQFYEAMAGLNGGRQLSPEIRNALSDITQTAVGADVNAPEWVGEIWQANPYERVIVPLVNGPALTKFKATGWKWTTKPAMAAYAGDKEDVTSNQPATDPVNITASRLAGAHDIDRAMVDFDNPEFWQGYYDAMTESYKMLSDKAAYDAMVAGATADATPDLGDGFLAALASGLVSLGTLNPTSTFAIANPTDLATWILGTTNLDVPAFLTLLGINPERIVPYDQVAAGHVLVGTRPAFEYRELGPTPIRVDAVNIAAGGVDAGAFGYYSTNVRRATGLQYVTITAPEA
jgi:ATP-dependent protease ClpP protease subunit